MRSTMAMVDIQKKLGFRYTTSIWLRNVNELPHVIRRLRESINRLVAEYSHLSQPEVKESLRLRQRTNDVLDDVGQILWPDGPRTHDNCPQWLMVAPCDMYHSNLFWNNKKHQARFVSFVKDCMTDRTEAFFTESEIFFLSCSSHESGIIRLLVEDEIDSKPPIPRQAHRPHLSKRTLAAASTSLQAPHNTLRMFEARSAAQSHHGKQHSIRT